MSADDTIVMGGDIADIPDGTYTATVDSITVRESDAYGEFRSWTFALEGGALVGGASSMSTSKRSKGGKWIRNVLGRSPDKGERVKLAGRSCMVVVQENDDGWPAVVDVLPPMAVNSGTAGGPLPPAAADAEDLPF